MGFVSRHPETISSIAAAGTYPQDRSCKSNSDVLEWTFKGDYTVS